MIISGVELTGRLFETETKLDFFKTEQQRLSIVFGKNGSGKSTVSRAFSVVAGDYFDDDLKAKLTPELSQDDLDIFKSRIKVFNEDFIDNNIKVKSDGLGSIVLLGDAVDVDREIEGVEKTLYSIKCEKEALEKDLIEKAERKKDTSYSDYWKSKIEEKLKAENGWAAWTSRIKSKSKEFKIKSKVTDAQFIRLMEMAVSEPISELYQKRDSKFELFMCTAENYNLSKNVMEINERDYIEKEVRAKELLQVGLLKNEYSISEERVFDTIQQKLFIDIDKVKQEFSNESTYFCPFCFRDIDKPGKLEIINYISRVLDEEAEKHKVALSNVSFPPLPSWDKEKYIEFAPELSEKITNAYYECSDIISDFNALIQKKHINVFLSINAEQHDLAEKIRELSHLIIALEQKIIEYYEGVKKTELIQKELFDITDKITHLELQAEFSNYKSCLVHEKNVNDKIESLTTELLELNRSKKALEQRKERIDIAPTKINNALSVIFFDNKRLQLQAGNHGKYQLLVKGKEVEPSSISVGERNAIALAYFFTHIYQSKNLKDAHTAEYLIVIDDPISSFDFENKIGMQTFLRGQLERLLSGNSNSRVILLSHDWFVVDSIIKAFSEFLEKKELILFILKDKCLDESMYKGKARLPNVYQAELSKIYEYALSDENTTNKYDNDIGNIMRRALERFSTFNCAEGIEKLSTREDIKRKMGEYGDYFYVLPYRLVLHGGSHSKDQVIAAQDLIPQELYSQTEKHKTAKQVLCMMYLINPIHISSHINTNCIEDIKKWLGEIKEQIND